MASAKTSCAVKSAKRFTGGPLVRRGGLIANNLRTALKSYARGTGHECGCAAPTAGHRTAPGPASVLALCPRADARRARLDFRSPGPGVPGQAQLHSRLAFARRRCRAGRDVA